MTVVLVRHASAGDASRWKGDDRLRPLDERGHEQALELVGLLGPQPATRILSSPYLRCVQTVEPLAATRGLDVEPREELGEDRQAHDGLELLRSLAATDAIVCTHGGSPWEELAGGDYAKGAALVLGNDGLPVSLLRPPV